jgi:tetratricopeptide (TPR) repeat protein
VLYRTGLLDANAQRLESATRSWRQSLELSSTNLDDILRAARQHLTPRQLVDEVLPSSTSILVTVVRLQQGDPALAEERELALAKAKRALDSEGLPAAEAHYWRGAIHALQGDQLAAIEEYLQAIRLRPDHTPWRYELALMYVERGMWDEAHEQAQWCARLAPHLPEIRALRERIHQARSTRSP